MVLQHISSGMTDFQAKNYVCQKIIINKISKSPMADRVLIKGGVVMFNLTKNLRRTTSDLDFDFIRYDISNESLKLFINLLSKYDSFYKVKLSKIEQLHQEDYKGKRLLIVISDKSASINFKLDVGVHTLLSIEQTSACFYFDDEQQNTLKVNPPEQIFAEKLYSLAKHGPLSTRFKDAFDMYYLINQKVLNKNTVRKCIELLTIRHVNNISSIDDVCNLVSNTFEDKQYIQNIKTTKDNWIDVDYQIMFQTILDFIYSI